MDTYRSKIYDGRRTLAPMATILMIVGLIFLTIPPIGIILIGIAIALQVRYVNQTRAMHGKIRQRLEAKREADMIKFYRSFGP